MAANTSCSVFVSNNAMTVDNEIFSFVDRCWRRSF
jgi:hypothetical protein